MRSSYGGVLVGAVCAVVVGCGGSTTPEPPPAGDAPTSEVSTVDEQPTAEEQPAPEPPPAEDREPTPEPPAEDPDPPGVPGSPIDYDSTVSGGGYRSPADVRETITGELASTCGPKLCGVTVDIVGEGECTGAIGPDPVDPGGTITIAAKSCEALEEEPEPESEAPAEEIPPSDGG